MTSKLKTDVLETVSGSGTIALTNQLSGMTSASMPSGSVIQVVNAVTTTRDTTSSAVPNWVATGITATITPTSTSSDIYISVSTSGNLNNTAGVKLFYTLYRDTTNLGGTSTGMGGIRALGGANIRGSISPNYLDSPATTSPVTYTLYFATNGSATVEIPGNAGQTRSITLMEIKG